VIDFTNSQKKALPDFVGSATLHAAMSVVGFNCRCRKNRLIGGVAEIKGAIPLP